MKIYLSLLLIVSVFCVSSSSFAASIKRTDGKPGSEYGDFSNWDGSFTIGARFGASFLTNGDKNSFLVGVDADYRPVDFFGFRLSFEQSLEKPRLSLIHFTPVIHSQYSNLRPYAFFGPGIAIVSGDDTKAKFSLAGGAGADFMIMDNLGFGMLWTYHFLLDSVDAHTLAARFSFWF